MNLYPLGSGFSEPLLFYLHPYTFLSVLSGTKNFIFLITFLKNYIDIYNYASIIVYNNSFFGNSPDIDVGSAFISMRQ